MSAPEQITVESVLRRIECRCKNALAYQSGDVADQDWARGHRCAGDYIMVTCKAIRAELRKQRKAQSCNGCVDDPQARNFPTCVRCVRNRQQTDYYARGRK